MASVLVNSLFNFLMDVSVIGKFPIRSCSDVNFLSFNVICLLLLAATTLTGMHFATTTLMTVVLRMLGYVQPSHLPLPDLLKFVLFANFSIVGMNVSLMWNSVGFYQVSWAELYLLVHSLMPSEVNIHFLAIDRLRS